MDDGGMLGKDARRALEKRQRRQRLEVRRILVEIAIVSGIHGTAQFLR
jgi:hypothetical protein